MSLPKGRIAWLSGLILAAGVGAEAGPVLSVEAFNGTAATIVICAWPPGAVPNGAAIVPRSQVITSPVGAGAMVQVPRSEVAVTALKPAGSVSLTVTGGITLPMASPEPARPPVPPMP